MIYSRMNHLILMGILLVISIMEGPLTAQITQVNDIVGYVVDATNGEALPFANVVVKEKDRGATTNEEGYFVIVNVPTGQCILSVSYMGYTTKDLVVQNRTGKRPPLRIDLEISTLNLEAVEVVADQYQIMKSSDEVSKITVAPRQLNFLPNLGEVDIFRSLQLLPGVSGSGDGSSGLYIRGGTPDQNMILLDGMSIYQVDHFFGMFSAFNADAIKDVQLWKGGFPAKYGGRLSSVIELTGRSGDKKRKRFGLGANLLSGQMLYETPTFWKGTWLISIRRSYTDYLQSPFYNQMYKFVFGDDTPQYMQNRRQFNQDGTSAFQTNVIPIFNFYDINSKFTFTPNDKDVFNVSVYVGHDNLDKETRIEGIRVRRRPGQGQGGFGGGNALTATRADDSNTQWGNRGLSMRWARRWSDRFYSGLQMATSLFNSDYTRNLYSIEASVGTPFNLAELNQVADMSFRWDNTWNATEKNIVEFGTSFTDLYTQYKIDYYDTVTVADITSESFLLNFYLQDKWQPIRSMDITGGIRVAIPTYLADPSALFTFNTVEFNADKPYIEPRLSFGWNLSDRIRLKGAWGHYHQFVNNIRVEDVLQGNSNFWLVSDENFRPGFSEHYILGLQYNSPMHLFSMEGYYKTLDNLVEFSRRNTRNADYGNFFFFGDGAAQGVELLAQKKAGVINGWIS